MNIKARLGVLLLTVTVAASCSQETPGLTERQDRSFVLETSQCGSAPHTRGSAIAIGDDRLLTAAHVVIGAGSVSASSTATPSAEVTVIALDPLSDLAVLQMPGLDAAPISFAEADAGDTITMVGGTVSGTVDLEIVSRANMDVFEVRGQGRSDRAGYRLAGSIATGDSGAGVYSGQILVGIVFAASSEGSDVAWATRSSAIEEFLAQSQSPTTFTCDSEQSRLVESS